MLKKRAQSREGLFWFVDILMFTIVAFLFFQVLGNVGEQTEMQKQFIASDIALLLDTLYALPGTLYMQYPQDTLHFGVVISKNTVEVMEKQSDIRIDRRRHVFLEDQSIGLSHKALFPKETLSIKENYIQKKLPILAMLLDQEITLDESQTMNLSFFKGHDEIIVEDGSIKELLHALDCKSPSKVEKNTYLVRSEQNAKVLEDGIFARIGSVISSDDPITAQDGLFIYLLPVKEKVIKVWYAADKGVDYSNYACTIANTMLRNNEDNAVASIPTNAYALQKMTQISSSSIMVIEYNEEIGARDVARGMHTP